MHDCELSSSVVRCTSVIYVLTSKGRFCLTKKIRMFLFILHDDDVIVCWCTHTQLRHTRANIMAWYTSTSLKSIFNEIIQRLMSLKSSINYIILSLVCLYVQHHLCVCARCRLRHHRPSLVCPHTSQIDDTNKFFIFENHAS